MDEKKKEEGEVEPVALPEVAVPEPLTGEDTIRIDVTQTSAERNKAAEKILRCYESYKSRRIFSFFRNLLGFHMKGTASLMLRSINPRESSLLEGMPGVHVRFRLGGGMHNGKPNFPPNILYRIYIHHGLCDIGSFAPRTYAEDSAMENKTGPILVDGADPNAVAAVKAISDEKRKEQIQSWYHRVEDNPWRPVSSGILAGLVEQAGIEKKHWAGLLPDDDLPSKPFHPNKLVRQQDVLAKRRKRQIEWRKRMWEASRDGIEAHGHGDGGGNEDGLSRGKGKEYRAPENLDEAFEFEFDLNEEADDLLEWTDNLDYDSYADEWITLGTTRMDLITETVRAGAADYDDFWNNINRETFDKYEAGLQAAGK